MPTATPIPTNQPTPIPSNTPIPTDIPVPVDCSWDWSACTALCGGGVQYKINITPSANGGTACSNVNSRQCNTNPCAINCEWKWGACTKSGNGCIRSRTRTVFAANGGLDCVDKTETCSCSDVNTSAISPVAGSDAIVITLQYNGNQPSTQGPTITQPKAQGGVGNLYKPPTATPIPPSPTPLPYVEPTRVIQTSGPTQIPIPTQTSFHPTQIPAVPTPTMKPESIIPVSLASQTNVSGNVTARLNTDALSDIKIRLASAVITNTALKSLLPQEQRQLAENVARSMGGILVTLKQKAGASFVTQQDELTVKRGNQFFSISNQATTPQLIAQGASNETKTSAAQLEINANNVIAKSSMGLSVDPLSGVLTVETPNGPQKVSIMPDEALGIIVELKALNTSLSQPSILLVSEGGKLIYRITGQRMEKFFGLLPITIQKQVLVSADTGSIIKIELSLLFQILSFFTF